MDCEMLRGWARKKKEVSEKQLEPAHEKLGSVQSSVGLNLFS
jgi:hypothetical protein